MSTSLQTLIPLLSSIALLLTAATAGRTVLRPQRKNYFKYQFSRQRPTDLTYQGDARCETNPAVLRLTRTDDSGIPQPDSIGRVVHTQPVELYGRRKQAASFESNLQFIIRPHSGACGPAEGLTFFIAPVNSPIGGGGGGFGIFNLASSSSSSIVAVEFDTYLDEGDPDTPHVGIDIGSQHSSRVTEVGGELVGQEVSASIRYNATAKLISVDGNAGSRSFQVSYEHDLSSVVSSLVQIGLSATTSKCVAVHDVNEWSFSTELVDA